MPCSHLFRIGLAGESGVGKSWFLKRLVDKEKPSSEPGTVGVDFASAVVAHAGVAIKLHFWDTAGALNYRKIVRAYFRGTDGVLLFFDVTDRQSFTRLAGWLAEVDEARRGGVRPALLVVGTKIDDAENRQVGRSEATAFAMREGCMYEEVSAESGENIGGPVVRLTEAMFDRMDGAPAYARPSQARSPRSRSRRRCKMDFCRLC